LDDIERAIAAKVYYPALLLALTVPEICMALSLNRETFVKEKHYVDTTPRDLGMNVIVTVPETGTQVHALSIKHDGKVAPVISLEIFCKAMIAAAQKGSPKGSQGCREHERPDQVVSQWITAVCRGAPIVASGS
jgi:hypothetical protein